MLASLRNNGLTSSLRKLGFSGKVPNFGGFPVETPTKKAAASKLRKLVFPGFHGNSRDIANFLISSEPPLWGRQKGVTPISSDLFRFPRFVPICAPCFWEFVPICSDLFRFLPICSDLFSEQIRTNQGNPFLPTPFESPRSLHPSTWKTPTAPEGAWT